MPETIILESGFSSKANKIEKKPVETPFVEVGMVATVFYFLYLLILIPVIGIVENSLLNYGKK